MLGQISSFKKLFKIRLCALSQRVSSTKGRLRFLIYALAAAFTLISFSLHANMPFSHSCEEKSFMERTTYPIVKPREEGYLKVSKVHTLYYALYGNPKGIPVVVLHGGPGAGCSDAMTESFDLKRWNVVMFDQRGALRSTPFGCMEENTPQHSVADIEALRKHLGIEKWMVFGGSWGSTLALLYGQEHQEQSLGFILRGVWLARKQDWLHLFYGMGRVFPEAYAPVVNHIPEDERQDLFSAYCRRIFDPHPEVHLSAARTFIRFDAICATHLPNPAFVESMLQNEKLTLGVMRTFCHYAKNEFYLDPHQILSRMHRISHLPALIVHGRWDAICPPEIAYSLHQKWSHSQLWMIPDGGHSANDPSIAGALVAATDLFAQEMLK